MVGGTAAEAAAALSAWAEALAAGTDDPAAEMLALVWGPRFDREHALALLARLPQPQDAWTVAIHAFAERFDALPAAKQQAVRCGILQIAENAACRESC
jgi:hypothetical protein